MGDVLDGREFCEKWTFCRQFGDVYSPEAGNNT